MSRKYIHFFVALSMLLGLSQCKKENFDTSATVKLGFSADTILFDTLFTTVGSTTKILKVYNRQEKKIRISDIRLEQEEKSHYRINVDGLNGFEHQDVEVDANDSIYIFIEVTLDPNNQNTPFIVEDALLFSTNGQKQKVALAAWGQDAYFHGSLDRLHVLPCSDVWTKEKPHVIYGVVAVDSTCVLTIEAGTQVYCHAGSGIYVYKGAININGRFGEEVVFQGDRLEGFYQDLSGQWGIEIEVAYQSAIGVEYATVTRGGIWIYEGAGSQIDYAILKNGIIGIQVDTLARAGVDALKITNTKIFNMSAIGLFAQGAKISGHNLLLSNCGQNAAAFTIGGEYQFAHCTFANYQSEQRRQAPTFLLNDYYKDINEVIQVRPITNSYFRNCIMYGDNAFLRDYSEFVVDTQVPELQDYFFQSCYVDSEQNIENGIHFDDMRQGDGPPFFAPYEGDFHLGINSGIFQASSNYDVIYDLDQVFRSSPVNIGCYQYVP